MPTETIADKLVKLNQIKANLKEKIEEKGVTVGTAAFEAYPGLVQSIPQTSVGTIVPKELTVNGTYYASADNADGYSPVTVAVPPPTLITKSITENGTYNASSDNADGYSEVIVNVPEAPIYWTPSGTPYLEEMTIPQTFTGINFTSFQSATSLKRFLVLAPNITNFQQYRLDGSMPNLEYVYLPYMSTANTYGANAVSLYGRPEGESAEIQLGSVGHPVTAIDSQAFGGGDRFGNPHKGQRWTATIYVNTSTLADIPSAVKDTAPWGATYLSSIVYRSSITGEVITE